MYFQAVGMLWGGLAASIPIILHFFYRSRFRDVPWAAMKFLRTAMEQTAQRIKFQELLLLILRVCLLLVLALALARPTFVSPDEAGGGDSVDAVIILDASLSMQARSGAAPAEANTPYLSALSSFAEGGTLTCLGRAQAAASHVVQNLPAHSTVRVIAAAGKPEVLGPLNPGHVEQAAGTIRDVKATEEGADLAAALVEAQAYLRNSPSANKEVYLFSDMQKSQWQAGAVELSERLKDIKEVARVHFVHCPARVKRNVAIVGITPQAALRSKERTEVTVLVHNPGKERVTNLTVSLVVDDDKKAREAQALPEIGPGETRPVDLSAFIKGPGRHVLSASVGPDELAGDNRLDQVVFARDQVGVLVVDGSPDFRDPRRSGSYFLMHALNPTVPPSLPVSLVPAGRAVPNDLQAKDLCVVVNARLKEEKGGAEEALSADFVQALGAFVKSGKSLLIVAGPNTNVPAYNKVLFEKLQLLPYPMDEKIAVAPGAGGEEDRGWSLDRTTAEAVPFGRIKDEKWYAAASSIKGYRVVRLKEKEGGPLLAEESRVLMRYSNKMPAVASRKRSGQGEVLLFTTAMHETAKGENDPGWSNWHFSFAMVPFVQMTVGHLLAGRPEAVNVLAGQALVWQVPSGEEEAMFDLVVPGGERKRLPVPAASKGRHLVTATETGRAGTYRIVKAGGGPNEASPLFAVAPLLSETEDLTALTDREVDEAVGEGAKHLEAGDRGLIDLKTKEPFSWGRDKTEWTTWLLLALLVMLLGEMALAWYCGRAW